MNRIVIHPKDQEEAALVKAILKRLKIQAHHLPDEGGSQLQEEAQEQYTTKKKAAKSNQYEAMEALLNEYADPNLFRNIDPVKWQNDLRDEWD